MRASAGVAILVGLLLGCLPVFAVGRTVRVCVRDQRGDAIVGARIALQVGPAQTVMTDASGCAEVVGDAGLRWRLSELGSAVWFRRLVMVRS